MRTQTSGLSLVSLQSSVKTRSLTSPERLDPRLLAVNMAGNLGVGRRTRSGHCHLLPSRSINKLGEQSSLSLNTCRRYSIQPNESNLSHLLKASTSTTNANCPNVHQICSNSQTFSKQPSVRSNLPTNEPPEPALGAWHMTRLAHICFLGAEPFQLEPAATREALEAKKQKFDRKLAEAP